MPNASLSSCVIVIRRLDFFLEDARIDSAILDASSTCSSVSRMSLSPFLIALFGSFAAYAALRFDRICAGALPRWPYQWFRLHQPYFDHRCIQEYRRSRHTIPKCLLLPTFNSLSLIHLFVPDT